MENNNNNLLVSVCMITYKHEMYIEQAITSILAQKVPFPMELVIVNDNSPDNTDDIVNRIIKEHPSGGIIKYIKHPTNIGAIPNFHFSFKVAKGKYIAICEGDDYWTDTNKLNKQIDFLEKNPDYSASFHDVIMKRKDEEISFANYKKKEINETVYFKDVINTVWLIPTCSFVFRKSKMILPPFFDKLNYGDFPLFCCILINSKAYYLKEQMGVYRRDNISSLTNTIRTFGHLSISADYVQVLTWLNKFAKEEDLGYIEQRINKEIEEIRTQVKIYKESKLNKLYFKLIKLLPKRQ